MRRIPLLPGLLALGGAIVGGAILGSRLARKLRRQTWEARPGRSPERPWRVTDFDEVEEVIGGTRCHCGGVLESPQGASELEPEGTMRVARSRCQQCGSEHELYFDLREVRH
ncbi:MAG: hypothetical protein P1V51_20690 [Deltaproteobacteria bacterium]|nr:hypothetical protein [Deltaproteobacteria bacterium]